MNLECPLHHKIMNSLEWANQTEEYLNDLHCRLEDNNIVPCTDDEYCLCMHKNVWISENDSYLINYESGPFYEDCVKMISMIL